MICVIENTGHAFFVYLILKKHIDNIPTVCYSTSNIPLVCNKNKERKIMQKPLLEIKNISKRYGKKALANNNISLEFNQGEIVALIGHNGAGKTTLLKQITGVVKPTSGEIYINGIDALAKPSQARKLVSSMPQLQAPLKGVTVYQAVRCILQIKGNSSRASKEKADEVIDYLQIGEWKHTAGENLSGGLQRLTSFAMSVTADVPIILLDEPTNDVDPDRRVLMWKYLRKRADEGTVILIVTHNLMEAERYADRYVLMENGCIKSDKRIG